VKFLRCSDILFAPLRVLANSHSTSTFGRAVSGLADAPYPATSESERSVSFNQLNPKTGHRIKHAKGDTGTAGATAELLRTLLPMKKTERLLGVSVSGFVEGETDAPAQIALGLCSTSQPTFHGT
jgi:hypothetical protein